MFVCAERVYTQRLFWLCVCDRRCPLLDLGAAPSRLCSRWQLFWFFGEPVLKGARYGRLVTGKPDTSGLLVPEITAPLTAFRTTPGLKPSNGCPIDISLDFSAGCNVPNSVSSCP